MRERWREREAYEKQTRPVSNWFIDWGKGTGLHDDDRIATAKLS